jgi:hypothetical protein
MYFVDGSTITTMRSAIDGLWSALASAVGPGWTYTVATSGEIIDSATGALTGSWTATTPYTNGSGSYVHAAGVGLVLDWNTAVIVDRRRLRGQTKVVPISGSNYAADGTLGTGTITAVQSAADAFLTAVGGHMRVWSRPRAARAAVPVGYRVRRALPALAARAGSEGAVSSAGVPDHVSTLRTRR